MLRYIYKHCRSKWPRGLRRRSAAARLLRSWVRTNLTGALMFVCCECCMLSGRGLCDELITRAEESYRLWCVVECDLETSRMRRRVGSQRHKKIYNLYIYIYIYIYMKLRLRGITQKKAYNSTIPDC